jgi:hypothetical protein
VMKLARTRIAAWIQVTSVDGTDRQQFIRARRNCGRTRGGKQLSFGGWGSAVFGSSGRSRLVGCVSGSNFPQSSLRGLGRSLDFARIR